MRVLLIDVNCKNSSTGDIVYDLYTALRRSGADAAVCYGRGPAVGGENIFKFAWDAETYLHALLTRLTGWTGCFSPLSTHRLLRWIDRFQPDVVHIHELHAYFVDLKPLLRYLARKNIRVIHTLHCEFSYTGKCGYVGSCSRWQDGCGHCPALREYPSSLLFDRTARMLRQKKALFAALDDLTVVTPSAWLADRAGKSFLGGREIRVIHNGVDTEIFRPCDAAPLRQRYGIGEEDKVVLVLASHVMSENKGGKTALRLAQALEGQKIRFVFVGVDGADGEMRGNAVFVGPIGDKRLLAQYYSLADRFLICSRNENFPTTCLEAQACGTAVCGFRVGGVAETLLDGEDGELVPYGDVAALEQILARCPRKTGEEALRRHAGAESALSRSACIRQYLRLYTCEA